MKVLTVYDAWTAAKELARKYWNGDVYLSKQRAERVERQVTQFGFRVQQRTFGYMSQRDRQVARDKELSAARSAAAYMEKREAATKWARGMPYADYLETEHWQTIRRRKLAAAQYQCEKCGRSGVRLDIHHLTYQTLGCESDTDLTVLCGRCHAAEHAR